ncbi:hypothetical protein MLD38_019074 [Melastoma candidum]|uniref:Uncharacterized protein n=1 Tax=Melastoma candidum TaxID=119954 RepID=A0ACB9QWW1_9MYRT|nr:hypothetical protein MLD38_019074 [Melastoma candidum]
MAMMMMQRLRFNGLLVLLLICFIPKATRARSLRAVLSLKEVGHQEEGNLVAKDGPGSSLEVAAATVASAGDDFDSMDYTPARKKPPIHN